MASLGQYGDEHVYQEITFQEICAFVEVSNFTYMLLTFVYGSLTGHPS